MVGNLQGTALDIASTLMAIQNPSTPRDRDEAEWKSASDIAKHPADYAPKRFLFSRMAEVQPWFDLAPQAIPFTANSNQELFGAYRNAVLEYEGACAKQLDALVWSLRTLMRLRDKPGANTARIDAVSGPLMALLSEHWQVPEDVLAQSAKDRNWSQKHTRQLELLPLAWRYV